MAKSHRELKEEMAKLSLPQVVQSLRSSIEYYRKGYGKKLGEENREQLLAGLVEFSEELLNRLAL